MHSYLRAIGFSELKKEKDTEELLDEVFRNYTLQGAVKTEGGGTFLEMSFEYGPDMGITLCGELDGHGFHRQYYFPYYKGSGITTTEELMIRPRVNGTSFSAACDDGRVGITIIFFVQNPADCQKEEQICQLLSQKIPTTFAGLSTEGMILLPVSKNRDQMEEQKRNSVKRRKLVSAAKNGNQEALENLTMDDMDVYSMVTRRIGSEDLYAIVDTFFMPYGIESDQYQVMGIIREYREVRNNKSDEEIYQIKIECNGLYFDVCINRKDLFGEPEVGRRFKGNIWLQGNLHFGLKPHMPLQLPER